MVGLVLVTPPALEPLTVAEVKAHCRLDYSQGEVAPTAPTAALVTPPAAGNINNGAHRYLVTFVTADGETEAGTISSAVTVSDKTVNGQVLVSGIPLGGAAVTSRKLYRTTAGGVTYLALATISDNTTTTYTDNVADASLGAAAPSTNTTADPYLTTLISVARLTCEDFTKRKLITQTWKQYEDGFPCARDFEVYLPPCQSVSSITYVDTNGSTQTLSTDIYQASVTGERARISLKDGQSWPTTARQLDTVCITFVTGYGTSRASVPAPLRQGMLMLIGHLYNVREDVVIGTITSEVPKASEYLWSPYVSMEF
jgi:uncharacterized phiE125 gp8 family phage protein